VRVDGEDLLSVVENTFPESARNWHMVRTGGRARRGSGGRGVGGELGLVFSLG
jgi:hypothetical protein